MIAWLPGGDDPVYPRSMMDTHTRKEIILFLDNEQPHY